MMIIYAANTTYSPVWEYVEGVHAFHSTSCGIYKSFIPKCALFISGKGKVKMVSLSEFSRIVKALTAKLYQVFLFNISWHWKILKIFFSSHIVAYLIATKTDIYFTLLFSFVSTCPSHVGKITVSNDTYCVCTVCTWSSLLYLFYEKWRQKKKSTRWETFGGIVDSCTNSWEAGWFWMMTLSTWSVLFTRINISVQWEMDCLIC